MTETYQVRDLTEPVVVMTGVRTDVVDTTHNEAKANKLYVEGPGTFDLDPETITSADGLLREVIHISAQYARRCDLEEIPCRSRWHADALSTSETRPRERDTSAPVWRRLPLLRLSRYTAGSALCFAVSEVAFFALFGFGLLAANRASIAASVIGVIPGYYLNRTWTWGRRGRSDFRREVAPYWATAIASAIIASLATGAADHAFLAEPRFVRTVMNAAAFMITYGLLFIAKYVVFHRLFARPTQDPGAAAQVKE